MEKKKSNVRVAELVPSGGVFGDLGEDPPEGGLATVIHGTYAESLPVGQMSVAAIRQRFRDLLDIHPEANAVLDGAPVDDDTIVRAGQNLMFVRRAGEKGRAA